MKQYAPLIVIVALVLISGYLYGEWRKAEHESKRKSTVIEEKDADIQHWQTESGRQAMMKDAAIANTKEFTEAYPKLADELKREFDIKVKDLKAIVRAEFQARGQGVGNISNTYYVDSTGVRYKEFKMDDGYLSFNTMLYDSSVNAPYKYSYTDTLTYGFTTKKKWLLAREKLYGFGGLKNPNAKITKTTNVLISDFRDKRFSVGPYAGYSLRHGDVDFGFSVQYSLFKF